MLSARRDATARIRRAPARLAARLGLRPDHVTWASLAIAAGAAALIGTGHLVAGALVAALAACLDFVDGELARLTGQVTARGGYLDSLVDRATDFLLLGAAVWHLDTRAAWAVGFVALFGSVVTSFAKARVYQDATPPPSAWSRDIAERPERLLVLLPAILAQGLADQAGLGWPILLWALVALAVATNLTVLQRARTAWRILGGPHG